MINYSNRVLYTFQELLLSNIISLQLLLCMNCIVTPLLFAYRRRLVATTTTIIHIIHGLLLLLVVISCSILE